MASSSPAKRWLMVFASVLLFGFVVEYYAQALAAFIVMECPDLSAHAPGHCKHPYWLTIGGIVVMALGAAGTLVTGLWAALRKLRSARPR